MPTPTNWMCDYCGDSDYETEQEARDHERMYCLENPDSEYVQRTLNEEQHNEQQAQRYGYKY